MAIPERVVITRANIAGYGAKDTGTKCVANGQLARAARNDARSKRSTKNNQCEFGIS
jgi:hypothetical protein